MGQFSIISSKCGQLDIQSLVKFYFLVSDKIDTVTLHTNFLRVVVTLQTNFLRVIVTLQTNFLRVIVTLQPNFLRVIVTLQTNFLRGIVFFDISQ